MSKEDKLKSSSSMKRTRLSDPTNGKTMLWKSKAMVAQATLDLPLASTQDGGKCSTEMETS
jgi:hypothetical protein